MYACLDFLAGAWLRGWLRSGLYLCAVHLGVLWEFKYSSFSFVCYIDILTLCYSL